MVARDSRGRFSLGAECWRSVSGAFPKNWFSLERHSACLALAGHGGRLPWGILEEAIVPRGVFSLEDQLQTVGSVEWKLPGWLLCPAPSWDTPGLPSAECQMPHASVGPQPLLEGLLEKESELRTSDLHERVFRMGLDSIPCDFSFPFKLDSGWECFLSGGSQLPRCCNLFLCFYREVFFFHLQDFLPPKEHIWTLCPLLIVTYQCWQLNPSCRRSWPSNTISNTVMHIMQHCDLI